MFSFLFSSQNLVEPREQTHIYKCSDIIQCAKPSTRWYLQRNGKRMGSQGSAIQESKFIAMMLQVKVLFQFCFFISQCHKMGLLEDC